MNRRIIRIIQVISMAMWLFAILWAQKVGMFASFGSLGFLVMLGSIIMGWLIIVVGIKLLFS